MQPLPSTPHMTRRAFLKFWIISLWDLLIFEIFICSCSQSYVYESRDEKNGFFAKHLLKNLTDEHKNKSIEEVLLGVSRGKPVFLDYCALILGRVALQREEKL